MMEHLVSVTTTTPTTSVPASATEPAPEPSGQPYRPGPERPGKGSPPGGKKTLYERIEAFISRLSTRSNFWNRVCSLVFLPYAFRSGIVMKRVDDKTFSATLPFTRFNKNWYNAMAGAALLGNAEIAGGMYVFGICGGDYMVVCKNLEFKFLRPCFGPAEYRITPREPLEPLIESGGEFNLVIDMDVVQTLPARRKGDKKARKGKPRPKFGEKRIGKCSATFHITPKVHNKAKGR